MLPQKRIEAQENEDGHGGLKVRVIGGGAASPAGEREVRNLEIGLRIGGSTARKLVRDEAEDEGPVHRLEAEDMMEPVQARDMSEMGPAEPRVSSHQAKGRNMKRWTVGMGIGSCVVAAVAVVAQLKARNAQTAPPPVAEEAVPKEAPRQAELSYLLTNLGSLTPEAIKLMERYAASNSAAEALPLIRDSARVREQVLAKWQPWGSKQILASGEDVPILVEDQTSWPSLVVSGKTGKFEPFELQLARDPDGALKIDWEASFGAGDFTVAQLQAGTKAKDSLIRAKVGPAKFYTPDYPESAYRSYQLTDITGYDFVWAFAPLNSPAADFLSKSLDQESRILEAGKSASFTLKVTGPRAPGVNMFLITEVLYKGWVAPVTEP